MHLNVFFGLPLIVVCQCQIFAAPMLDNQNVPLSALINVSHISSEIVRSLEKPINDLITSTVKTQVDVVMNQIRHKDLKVLQESVNNNEKEIQELTKVSESNESEIKELKKLVENLKIAVVESKQAENPSDCVYINKNKGSGIYTISPGNSSRMIQVFCEMDVDGGGWTVFQRRVDSTENFTRDWEDYKNGFGDLRKEFWLGNSKLHEITNSGQYELRVDIADFENNTRHAKYSSFAIGGKDTNYKLTVGGYSGDAGDSLDYQNGKPFTTIDKDNDHEGFVNCAEVYGKGGWWYANCHYSNLNGEYLRGKHNGYHKGIMWKHWKGYYYSLKSTSMMIRKVK